MERGQQPAGNRQYESRAMINVVIEAFQEPTED
jgi:hypothetical protein